MADCTCYNHYKAFNSVFVVKIWVLGDNLRIESVRMITTSRGGYVQILWGNRWQFRIRESFRVLFVRYCWRFEWSHELMIVSWSLSQGGCIRIDRGYHDSWAELGTNMPALLEWYQMLPDAAIGGGILWRVWLMGAFSMNCRIANYKLYMISETYSYPETFSFWV